MMEKAETSPLISVVIPAYNAGVYLSDTLQSVLGQDFRDVEVVVVDDGSTDNTRQVVEQFQQTDSRVRYYYQKNSGVSVARNTGIENARGTFVAFLDSDDTYEPAFLQTMAGHIQATDLDFYHCGYYYRREGRITGRVPDDFEVDDALEYVLKGGILNSVHSWCVRRSFLNEKGLRFVEHCSYGEDMELFYKLLYRLAPGRREVVKEFLANYNIHPNSLSQRESLWYPPARMLGEIQSKKRVYDYMGKYENPRSALYIALAAERLKKTYLYYLWGTLLLGPQDDFETLYREYCGDRASYPLDKPLKGIKNKVWEFCVTTKPGQWIGRFVFRPYKRLQRSSVRMK